MAKSKSNKKVVVTKTSKATPTNSKTKKVQPTKSKGSKSQAVTSKEMIFGRENFKWIFIGLALITLGSPDVWDDSIIYSHRRITLAPLLILAGLGVEIYAIFK